MYLFSGGNNLYRSLNTKSELNVKLTLCSLYHLAYLNSNLRGRIENSQRHFVSRLKRFKMSSRIRIIWVNFFGAGNGFWVVFRIGITPVRSEGSYGGRHLRCCEVTGSRGRDFRCKKSVGLKVKTLLSETNVLFEFFTTAYRNTDKILELKSY